MLGASLRATAAIVPISRSLTTLPTAPSSASSLDGPAVDCARQAALVCIADLPPPADRSKVVNITRWIDGGACIRDIFVVSYCLPKLTARKQGKDKKDKDRNTIRDRCSALGLIQGRLGTVFVVCSHVAKTCHSGLLCTYGACASVPLLCVTRACSPDLYVVKQHMCI